MTVLYSGKDSKITYEILFLSLFITRRYCTVLILIEINELTVVLLVDSLKIDV